MSEPGPEVPRIPRGKRLTGQEREDFKEQIVAAYRAGYGSHRIAAVTGRTPHGIRILLREAGVTLRPSGRPTAERLRQAPLRQANAERIRQADEALTGLRDALRAARVDLPAMGVHEVTWARSDVPPQVDLGTCDLDTASLLAKALRALRRER